MFNTGRQSNALMVRKNIKALRAGQPVTYMDLILSYKDGELFVYDWFSFGEDCVTYKFKAQSFGALRKYLS